MHHSVMSPVASRDSRPTCPSSRPIFAAIASLMAASASQTAQAAAPSTPLAPARAAGVPMDQTPSAQNSIDGQTDEKKAAQAADAKDEKFTLERFLPEKSFFGPGARSIAFSRDGRFGAFLYRSFPERRHGADLYILDTANGGIRRITSVGRMSEHQASARKVRDERAKKAAAAGFTLPQLARDQYEQLGWTDGMIAATWEGAATSTGSTLPPGPLTLRITQDTKEVLSAELQITMVRVSAKTAAYDPKERTLKLTIDDTTLKIKGEASLSLSGGTLSGDLILTEPAQTLSLTATRKPAEPHDRKKSGPAGVINAIGERLTLGDILTPDDAEINDEKDGKPPKDLAPRYSGVASIEWSPKGHELLLVSDGDIYRLAIDLAKWEAPVVQPPPPAKLSAAATPADAAGGKEKPATDAGAEPSKESLPANAAVTATGEKPAEPSPATKPTTEKAQEFKPFEHYRGDLTRITRTRESESDVQYLPDGSGYTYLRDGALLRVTFGDSSLTQLDPELKDGERMVGYRISPDLKRLAFLATRSKGDGNGRGVTIISYRDRFAKASDVGRHMPDDPLPEAYSSVYLFDLTGHEKEEGKLERVFTRKVSGPRDVMRVPEWSPDSTRIAFAAFEQKSGKMKILEAGFVPKTAADKKPDSQAPAEPAADAAKGESKKDETRKDENQKDETKKDETKQSSSEAKPGSESSESDKSDFKIENAKVVFEFLHNGGPNTPSMVTPEYLPDSRRMVFITEISGFRHLHMLDPRLEELTQITRGQYEVYPFHLTHDHTTLFATTTQGDPNQEHIYKIQLVSGEVTRLSAVPGVYASVGVREDGSRALAMHTDFATPSELVDILPGEKPEMKRLTDSHPEEAHTLTGAVPEYFTYENRHGQTIHGHLFKPEGWKAADKRPLIIYVYGGPLGERKMATRGTFAAPSYFFARYMAQTHGYVMATIDPRGASGYGAVFEKANFEQVGKPQTEDLVDGAKWLVKNHGVDEKRTGLHGWSFGGFQTQMVMYTEPDVFAAGIAGAGPTEWQNYNSWYSTGTIGNNEPGKVDLEKYSLLPLAKNLKGRLMLVHGMEDSNVLFQDTVRVYRELLKAKKEVNVELFLDPTGGHGLGGDVKTLGRYRKYEEFFLRHLGKGAPAAGSEPVMPAEPAKAPDPAPDPNQPKQTP